MISIIICSRSEISLKSVIQNVRKTIGIENEVIAIDNNGRKYGICEAYNVGAAQAKYDNLCFMHEDIAFHTQDWGKAVIELLDKPETGVLGVAGSRHQPKAPAGWGGAFFQDFLGVNVVHTQHGKTEHSYLNPSPEKHESIEAIALDGLWLCCRKSVWEEFKFDSQTFPGFHFYDVDFSLRVSTKYKNYIVYNILIEHFSHGTFNKVWMENALHFYKNRHQYLPATTANLTKTITDTLDLIAMQKFALIAVENNLPKKDALYCVAQCFKLQLFNRDNFYLLKRALTM